MELAGERSPLTKRELWGLIAVIIGVALLLTVLILKIVFSAGYWTAVLGPLAIMFAGASMLDRRIFHRRA
jgi:hypothetical protein